MAGGRAAWVRVAVLATLAAGAPLAGPAAEDDAFALREIPIRGRVAAAEITDLDGDGRGDLLVVSVDGIPPDERRELHVHFQGADGEIPLAPSWRAPLPAGAAAYDLGALDARPGDELILLRADGLAVLSLAGRSPVWHALETPGVTAAPAADERGLDRLDLLRPELGNGRLLVPGFGTAWLLDAAGTVLGALRVGGRANYFVPPRPGLVIDENELALFYDVPRLDSGDVDGDGRVDVVSGSRHELRVFHQRPDGRFPTAPDAVLPLRLLTPEEHVRNTGGVRADLCDWNGDGRADLLLAHASGGLLHARTQTRLYQNRDGHWSLGTPDQVFERAGGVAADQCIDLDGDGHPELLRIFLPLGLLDVAELFVQRAVDVEATVHRRDGELPFTSEPVFQRRFSVGISFETMRPAGFVPTVAADWNGDGYNDLLGSGDGRALELWLGGPAYAFGSRQVRQRLDTGGLACIGDLDGDGLPDLVLYDPRRPGTPVRLLHNRGHLPGTPSRHDRSDSPTGAQRPFQAGLRFSAKARGPST